MEFSTTNQTKSQNILGDDNSSRNVIIKKPWGK